jgi:hypothetical protein
MTNQEKLELAKEYLGKKYILHPEYERKNNPAHSYFGSYFLDNFKREIATERKYDA